MSREAPFFIVGSARSGTTLLRLILNAHPKVAVPPESRFVIELYRGSQRIEIDPFLSALASHKRFQTWDLPIAVVTEELRSMAGDATEVAYPEAITAAFRAYARVNGKSRWGDKTPRYVEHLELLARLFPTARFIHLIRDGRNVALSYANVPFGPKTIGKAAALWAKRVCAGYQVGRSVLADRYLEVLYEDLVEDAEGETRDICAFIGVEFDPGMLDYTERARGSVLQRASAYNPHVTEKPTANVRSWQDSMPPDQVEVFEAVAGDTLSLIGYERAFPHPSAKARAIARLSARGLPVAKIRERA
ncbi:MAG TPA: sulfotransferase [Actinomycetota bacterium]|nr:sulfotransferase [Actinomycetota bacterium]